MNEIQKTDKPEITTLPMVGLETYHSVIKLFNEWNEGRPLTIENIIAYLKEEQKTKKPATMSAKKFGIKKAVKSLGHGPNRIELARLDEAFKEIRIGKRDPKVYAHRLPKKEIVFKVLKEAGVQTSLVLETFFYTGLRVSELCDMRFKDCAADGEGKFVYIKIIGKGSKEREIFMTADLFKRISATSKGRDYLFENTVRRRSSRQRVWKMIKNGGQIVDRTDFHPHMFRHVCATYLLKELGMSLKAVSLFLGHANVSITAQVYIEDNLTPEDVYGK